MAPRFGVIGVGCGGFRPRMPPQQERKGNLAHQAGDVIFKHT